MRRRVSEERHRCGWDVLRTGSVRARRRRRLQRALGTAGLGDLITAEIEAAVDIGMRFTATRGSMSLSKKAGGLPPDSVVQDDDEILARLIEEEDELLAEGRHGSGEKPRTGEPVRGTGGPAQPDLKV